MDKNQISPTDLKQLGNVRGTEYVYPERMHQITALTKVMYETASKWGYVPVDGPTMQPVEFYSVKSSDELLKDGYYISSGDRTYMLRPEITPTIAYMLAEAEKRLTYPVRWFSDPQIYRNERPQSGRRRQFGQFNLDRFDLGPLSTEARALADAEVISEAIETLVSYGLTADDIVVRINSRSMLERAFDTMEILDTKVRNSLLTVIDAKEKLPEEVFMEKAIETGIDTRQSELLLDWLALASFDSIESHPIFHSVSQTDEYKELILVLDLIGQHGYGEFANYDPIIVRGLGYYTGTVFEAVDRQPEKSMKRSILGGGRYDKFTQKFGGKLDVTGVGFGMGHVPLEIVLQSRDLLDNTPISGPEYYIVAQEDSDQSRTERLSDILNIAKAARMSGNSILIDASINSLGEARLKKQMNNASKAGALKVIIFLNNTENITIKELSSGRQDELTIDTFLASLNNS